MITTIWRIISDICWKIGAESLAMKFLLKSLDNTSPTNVVEVTETKHYNPIEIPKGPFDISIIYEDKEFIKQANIHHTNDIVIPRTIDDIN